MNCLGDELANYFRNIPEINDRYTIQKICTYSNLHNTSILRDIQTCDILITNNIKNYPHLTYDSLRTQVKPSCKICKIEFVRFDGYFPLSQQKHANFLNVYDESTNSPHFNEYRDFSISKEVIQSHFHTNLSKLKELDNQSDIKFYEFFLNNHSHTSLFRDNTHLTHTFLKHIVKETLAFLGICTSISIDDLSLAYMDGFKFRIRPVLSCVKEALGLSFDTNVVNMFNTNISIEQYYTYIQNAKHCRNFQNVERLFYRMFPTGAGHIP